ncbi:hypothetical protein ACSBR1_018845 [Camellia fascicularis]
MDLKRKCRQSNGGDDATVALDVITPNRLDNKYYVNLMNGHGVLVSDQTLWTSKSTVGMVMNNAKHERAWASKFGDAMVRMGSIEVLIGARSEIRRNCRVVNK